MIIDLSKTPENKKILAPVENKPIIVSTITSKFRNFSTEKERKVFHGQLLGFKSINDFFQGKVYRQHPSQPRAGNCYTGILWHKSKLFACNKSIVSIFGKNERAKIEHPLFNDLHWLCLSHSKKRILVTCSGTDCLVELDTENHQETWRWFAHKSLGHDKKYYIGPAADYSKKHISTSQQLAHLNTANYFNKKGTVIGATLFHQGRGILIDKKTKKVSSVISGQRHPHGFSKFGKFFVMTNTEAGEVQVLNANFENILTIIGFNSSNNSKVWIQNALPITNHLLAIINQNEKEIVFVDIKKKQQYSIKHNPDWKIYQLLFSDNINLEVLSS